MVILVLLLLMQEIYSKQAKDLIINTVDNLKFQKGNYKQEFKLEIELFDSTIKYLTYPKNWNVNILDIQFYIYDIDKSEQNNKILVDTIYLNKDTKTQILVVALPYFVGLKDIELNFKDNFNIMHTKNIEIYVKDWEPKYKINKVAGAIYNCKTKKTEIEFNISNYSDNIDFQLSDIQLANLDSNDYEIFYIDKGFFKNSKTKIYKNDKVNINSNNYVKFLIEVKKIEFVDENLEFSTYHQNTFYRLERISINNSDLAENVIYLTYEDLDDDYEIDFSKYCVDSLKVVFPPVGLSRSFYNFQYIGKHKMQTTKDEDGYAIFSAIFYRKYLGKFLVHRDACYSEDDYYFIVKDEDE